METSTKKLMQNVDYSTMTYTTHTTKEPVSHRFKVGDIVVHANNWVDKYKIVGISKEKETYDLKYINDIRYTYTAVKLDSDVYIASVPKPAQEIHKREYTHKADSFMGITYQSCYVCNKGIINTEKMTVTFPSGDKVQYCNVCGPAAFELMKSYVRKDLKGHTNKKEVHTNWDPNNDDFAEDV